MAIDLGQDVSPPAPSRLHGGRLQVLALVVVLGAVLSSIWGTPRQASEAAFGAALSSGDVRAVVRDLGAPIGTEVHFGVGAWFTSASHSSVSSILWTSSDGRIYRTELGTLTTLPPPARSTAVDQESDLAPGLDEFGNIIEAPKVDVARSIEATADESGVAVPDRGSLGWSAHLGDPLGLLLLVACFALAMGPQPRRFTKWGQFWLLGLPAGAGLLWWILRDAPFDPRMRAAPEPAPRLHGAIDGGIERRSGARGFAWALLGSLVLSVVVAGIVQATIWGDRPEPQQGSVTFQVVYDDGQQGTLTL